MNESQSVVDVASKNEGDVLRIGAHVLSSRLIVGTGKYETFTIMRDALEESGTANQDSATASHVWEVRH